MTGKSYLVSLAIFVALCAFGAITASGCGSQGACAVGISIPDPPQAAPGETFHLQGEGFSADCFDTPGSGFGFFGSEPSEKNIRIELRQGDSEWLLDAVDAGPSPDYALDAQLTVPADAEPGSATVMVHTSSETPIEVPLRVLGRETALQDR